MTIKTTFRSFAFAATFMLGMTATVLAQATSGTLRGTVLDPSGALVPQAQVTITNASGFSRTLKSGATGSFEVPHLTPGRYSVSIYAAGFTSALDGNIPVLSAKVTDEQIKLGISVNQEIDVNADEIYVAK